MADMPQDWLFLTDMARITAFVQLMTVSTKPSRNACPNRLQAKTPDGSLKQLKKHLSTQLVSYLLILYLVSPIQSWLDQRHMIRLQA